MKQLLQSLRTGELEIAEVPDPACLPGRVLVRTSYSFVSPGTERASRQVATSNLLQKARQRPDQVRKVLKKIKTEGWRATLEKVRTRLEEPMPLGYSCAGVVLEVGEGVEGIYPGDRVACAGAGYAVHAEKVCVPKNLIAKVPEGVSLDEASGATLCAIALQSLRVGEIEIGEIVGVIGLGLIGQITVQMLKASGCRVVGIDLNRSAAEFSVEMGADRAFARDDPIEPAVRAMTGGHGLDAVLICAATESNDPVELAGTLARKKGRVVALGTVSMDIPRRVYYPKELELRLSTSYGPGRYDPEYEERGRDYPYAYVRFTEQRNLETSLSLMADGRVRLRPLIRKRFPFEQAESAYSLLEKQSDAPLFGIVFEYPQEESPRLPGFPLHSRSKGNGAVEESRDAPGVAVVGAGRFAGGVLLPILKTVDRVRLLWVVSGRGSSARTVARRFSIPGATCRFEDVLEDSNVNAVLIATRHHLHANQVIAAVEAGKDVFVEKPLALKEDDLVEVEKAVEKSGRRVMVGFNRRFAPFGVLVKEWFAPLRGVPLLMTARINAGRLEEGSWLSNPDEGGGRILGEVCHFVDLFLFWAGSPVEELSVSCLRPMQKRPPGEDNLLLTLRFRNGSAASLVYTSEGAEGVPKERYEIHGGGRSALLEDFRRLDLYDGEKKHSHRLRSQDKGHRAELEGFIESIRKGTSPDLSFQECCHTTRVTFEILSRLRRQPSSE